MRSRVKSQPGTSSTRRLRRLARWAVRHPATAVFLVAITVRVALAVAVWKLGLTIAPDQDTYWNLAELRAAGKPIPRGSSLRVINREATSFMLLLGWVRYVFGPSQLVGKLFVALLGAGAAALTATLARRSMSGTEALAAGLVVALYPSQVMWSSLLLKDAFVWLLLVSTGCLVVVAQRAKGWLLVAPIVALAATLLTLGNVRRHTFVVACWAVLIASLAGARSGRRLRIASLTAVVVVVPWVAAAGPAGVPFVLTNAREVSQRRAGLAVGATSAFVPTEVREVSGAPTTPGAAGRIAPGGAETAATAEPHPTVVRPVPESKVRVFTRGILVMIFQPAPWQLGSSAASRLAALESLLWYPLLLLAALGVLKLARKPEARFPLLAAAGVLVMYGLSEGNLGTAFRHRGEVVWVVSMAAVAGMSSVRSRRSRRPGGLGVADRAPARTFS